MPRPAHSIWAPGFGCRIRNRVSYLSRRRSRGRPKSGGHRRLTATRPPAGKIRGPYQKQFSCCIKCGSCVAACPTEAIDPAYFGSMPTARATAAISTPATTHCGNAE
ncbi:MAG: 4Fe-4S binding protein [Acidiferrobacterales bacterium]